MLKFILSIVLIGFHLNAAAADEPLDNNLAPTVDEEVSNVFRDMGVVQKKAMEKRNRFLLSTYASLDFSDGPYTSYGLHLNPGYAFSDFFEVYANFVPYFLVQKRSIVDKVAALPLTNQYQAGITAARPKYSMGLELLWAPLYGKDSLGLEKIIRSDTFVKFGASQISYEGDSGMEFKLGVGKTFFMNNHVGIRFCFDYAMMQQIDTTGGIINKSFKSMLLIEGGVVIYL